MIIGLSYTIDYAIYINQVEQIIQLHYNLAIKQQTAIRVLL